MFSARFGLKSWATSGVVHRITCFASNQLRQMPYGLRVLSRVHLWFAFLFPASTLILLLMHGPNSPFSFSVGGKHVTYEEFLRSGGFLWFFLFGIYSGVLAFGFLRATRWSRPLCFLPTFVWLFATILHPKRLFSIAVYHYLIFACEVGLLVWYLFFRRTVRDYFARMRELDA